MTDTVVGNSMRDSIKTVFASGIHSLTRAAVVALRSEQRQLRRAKKGANFS